MIQELVKLLGGRKTYLVSAAMALATFAYAMGWIDEKIFLAIQGFLIPGGLSALRAGVEKGGGK